MQAGWEQRAAEEGGYGQHPADSWAEGPDGVERLHTGEMSLEHVQLLANETPNAIHWEGIVYMHQCFLAYHLQSRNASGSH